MNILMMTNSYTPHISGVEQSILSFTEVFRTMGHKVKIIAPETDKPVNDDEDVIRVTAIKNFNHTDYPVGLPLPGELHNFLNEFKPDIVHSHFPFFIGSTALRVATACEIPLVFTYHTMYDRYIHYISCESDRIREFVRMLTSGYCNLCDMVIAPSTGVKNILIRRQVNVPIEVIPTGINTKQFASPSTPHVRKRYNIPDEAFVTGYAGRFTTEKNLEFLATAIKILLSQKKDAYFMMVGDGPLKETLKDIFSSASLNDRVIFTGKLQGGSIVDAYHCMDLFTFASQTETQGMVLAEAMAAGVPVAAIEGPGITDIVQDGFNGFLINTADHGKFAEVIEKFYDYTQDKILELKKNAIKTANDFSIEKCANMLLEKYKEVINSKSPTIKDTALWATSVATVKAEWEIFSNYFNALTETLLPLDRKEVI